MQHDPRPPLIGLRSVAPAGASLFLLLAGLAGCESDSRREPPPEPPPAPLATPDLDPIVEGTVGLQTTLTNIDLQPMRGFGVVIGLDGRGSRECPAVIRDYLLEYLGKEFGPHADPERRLKVSATELLDSLDSAVVEVTGMMPAGAPAGTRFDVAVSALAGTSTESLEGGLLLPTQMRYFDRTAGGEGLVAGATLAMARGPIFTNPFAGTTGTTDADRLGGTILGGGSATEERVVRLMLLQPNYQLAKAIERRINERFGHPGRAADAMSAGYVELHTPREYAHDPARFRQLVAHLFIDNRPAAAEAKRRELVRLAITRAADLERVAAAWEALGRVVLDDLRPLYTHADPIVVFFAARTGVRLGDVTALPALASAAESPAHPHRLLAIEALGESSSPQVAPRLAPLLSDPDQQVRIATYEALVRGGHPAIRHSVFRHVLDRKQLNFILDEVDSNAPPMIYVRRTRLPRIAVFGARPAVHPPVFYSHPDDSLTIHTVADSTEVRLYAKYAGRMSEQIIVAPRIADLIRALGQLPLRDEANQLVGLGLPYSRAIEIVGALCDNGTVAATLSLEETSLTRLLGPAEVPGRPEGDRPETDADAREARRADTWPPPEAESPGESPDLPPETP